MRDEAGDIKESESENTQPKRSTEPEAPLDPNDVIPVPVAMEPAEIDERAQVVEALRARERNASSRREDSRDDDRMEG